MLQDHDRFLRHKLLDVKRRVSEHIVMMRDTRLREQFRPNMANPLSQTFQNLKANLLIDLTWWNKLSVLYPLFSPKETHEHRLGF
jgi:hypothetical protein